ncbi:unnamed protein product [Colias eurytheme]|nr:unnamed protein product [Colias eurytheme]
MYLSSASSQLLLYDANSYDLKKSYKCYDGVLRDVSWSDDSKYLLQVNSKGLVEVLTPAEHEVRSLQHIPVKDSWSASFHRDGHRNVAIGTKNGEVMIWDTKNKGVTKAFPTPPTPSCVNIISYNSKNTSLAASMQNGDTVIYGLVSNIPVCTVKLNCSKSISAMKFHHESRSSLGLATDEGHVILRDITTNKDKALFENIHASPVSDFTFSLINRDVMLSSGYDKVMHVYDTRLQNVVSTIKTSYALTSLAINTENHVALGTKNGYVIIYDLRDLTMPFKILKGHEEEVRKVAFQPHRKKTLSTELSINERVECNSPMKVQSPVRSRNSDLFYVNNTPPKVSLDVQGSEVKRSNSDNKADSFLVMMGLDDKSNVDFEDEFNKSPEHFRKSDKIELRYRQLDAEKNINKASTPLSSRGGDNIIFPSPLVINGVPDDGRTSNTNIRQANLQPVGIDNKTVEELKDFIKLSLSYVADDNRRYFLNTMMELTKQKLYLEKQLANMSNQIDTLVQNQNALIEANRKLVLQVDQLKSEKNSF